MNCRSGGIAVTHALWSQVILNQKLFVTIQTNDSWICTAAYNIILFSLPFIAIGLAILMISRVRYSHILNRYLRGRKPFAYLIGVIAFIFISIFVLEIALVVVFCTFTLSGFFRWFYRQVIAKRFVLGKKTTHVTITSSKSENQ